jgi:hypothetical protein
MNQYLMASALPRRQAGKSAGWVRGALVIGVMTLLVLGMNPDGGRHTRVSDLESNAKLVLAVGIGMVTAGRFVTRSPRTIEA